jgi:peptidoglycan/LPS O-acetylase OafA/YrhL
LTERGWRAVLIVLAATQLALFAWMVVSPGTFFESIGGFGARNDHYIRDSSVFPLAIGIGLLAAARWATWRLPVLAVTAIWYLAHAVNHLVDVADSDPGWAGPADFASLLAGGVAFALLALAAREATGEPSPDARPEAERGREGP